MSQLTVSGASLYYEVVGQGPVLFCISGGDGSCEIWRGFAESLKEHFTVVMWDRRGFSRSVLLGPQDYEQRLETDVDDAATLIRHVSPNEPVRLIGNSSGAIVSLKLVAKHPDLVHKFVCHEPPAAKLLSDFDTIWASSEEVYATYRRWGLYPAMGKFCELIMFEFPPGLIAIQDPKVPFAFANLQYWMEREFLYYPKADINLDELKGLKDKVILINGAESNEKAYQVRTNVILGKELGLNVVNVPGGHLGHATHAGPFAQQVASLLSSDKV